MKKIAFIILSSVMMNSCTDMNLIPESNLSPEPVLGSIAESGY